jgi:hypothetical protein
MISHADELGTGVNPMISPFLNTPWQDEVEAMKPFEYVPGPSLIACPGNIVIQGAHGDWQGAGGSAVNLGFNLLPLAESTFLRTNALGEPAVATDATVAAGNRVGSGLRPLVSDMPELIWNGTRILGKAQATKTPGHVLQIAKQVQRMAQSGEYEYITLNRSWKVSTGLKGAAGDLRPDIIGVRWDGVVDAFEVMSMSDDEADLLLRLNDGLRTLPNANCGRVRVIPYPYR